jgi:hypothetical protein
MLSQIEEFVSWIRSFLKGRETTPPEPPEHENRKRLRDLPPSPAFLGVEIVYPIYMRLSTNHVRYFTVKDENIVVCSGYSRQSLVAHW